MRGSWADKILRRMPLHQVHDRKKIAMADHDAAGTKAVIDR